MQPVWLKNYAKGVPYTIDPDSYGSLNTIYQMACENYADKIAYINMGTKLSYRTLNKNVRDLAAFFQNHCGLKKGDRVAVMLPNLLQYPVVIFAVLQAGLTVVNVNPLYTARELHHQLNDSEAETIVVLANFAHTVAEVCTTTKLKNIIITEVGDLFAWPKSVIVNSVAKYIKKMVPRYVLPQAICFKDALQKGKTLPFEAVDVKGSDLAFLQYTGGTTGIAKGAMLTHRNMVANVLQAHAWVAPTLMGNQQMVVTALPLYHVFALTANCLLFLYMGGTNLLITNPRDIPGFIKAIKHSRFSVIGGVNTLFNALLNHPEFAKVDFSELRVSLGGGMAVQRAVADKWKAITGCTLVEAYGLTETSPAACINPMDLVEFNGCIGLPISSTEILIRDEAGNALGFNQPGELCIRGPQVTKGYWNREEETAKVLDADGWLATGDIAMVLETGFVKLIDRKKDMILVSGFNVYPNEIEDVIALHPGVKEVAVIGIPNEASGEQVIAYIVKKDFELTEKAVIHFCKERLTGYKIPKKIIFKEELPKSNVGKILRRVLRDSAESQ